MREALSKILTAMLNDLSLDGVILIIDALDECTDGPYQLLKFISKPSHVKWIVSSRYLPSIEDKLDKVMQKVRLHLELKEDSVSKAVENYIGYWVERLTLEKNYDQEKQTTVKTHLTDNAGNTFLWMTLVCKELARLAGYRHTISIKIISSEIGCPL